MKSIFKTALFLGAIITITTAPNNSNAQEILSEPICFNIVNTAEFTVSGSVITDYFTRPDGVRARHRSNFRLQPKGSTNAEKGFPTDRAEFCAAGPFYPDRKLDLALRTLVPVFTCRTRVDQGDLLVIGKRTEDGTKMEIKCFE